MATNLKPEGSTADQTALEKFLDNFLRESSIKWMALVGAAIVASCSLMLVTRNWSSWPAAVKFLTILCYTVATYGVAEFCDRRLRLQVTSQVLKLLTLLLIPIGFLSLAWLTSDADSASLRNSGLLLLLLVPASGFMFYASDRIFRHWLHGRQLTFLVAYMILCLAGALPVANDAWLAILFSSGFWIVMTLGVVKVNRHLFWLTEEHRWPRIFGFAPIALLGMQAIVLFVVKANSVVPIHWVGLGFVMLAATILMTTRTIAAVFRQRTGDLVRPLPWTIVAPLITALILTAAGVLFSFHGFQFKGVTTFAVMPTAIIAAALALFIAKDTKHQGFVWLGMILITLAYRAAPTLFHGLVEGLKEAAAASLHEERLPLAFYGLTTIPLLFAFAFASRWFNDRKRFEFSVPLQSFVTVVSLILVAISLTNVKAAFLVNAVSAIGFVFYAVMFRNRHYTLLTIGSLVIAAASLVPFANAIGLARCEPVVSLVVLAILGLALSATNLFDRLANLIPAPSSSGSLLLENSTGQSHPWVQLAGVATTFVVGSWWVLSKIIHVDVSLEAIDFIIVAIVTTAGLLWTIRDQNYLCGLWTWFIVAVTAWLWIFEVGANTKTTIAYITILAGVAAITGYLAMRMKKAFTEPSLALDDSQRTRTCRCSSRFASVVLPLADLSLAHFVLLATLCYVPSLLVATFALDSSGLPMGWPLVYAIVAIGAIVFRGPLTTSALLLISPVVAGVSVGCIAPSLFSYVNLPLIYTVTIGAMSLTVQYVTKSANSTSQSIYFTWLAALIALGAVCLQPVVLVSSVLAIVTLYLLSQKEMTNRLRTHFAIFSSLQSMSALAMISGFQGWIVELPISGLMAQACALMISGLVIAILCFDTRWSTFDLTLARQWSLTLRVVGLAMLLMGLCSRSLGTTFDVLILVSLAFAAANELRIAVRYQIEPHAWTGFSLIGLLLVWSHWHHVLPLHGTVLRLLIIAAAAAMLMLARRWSEHSRFNLLVHSLGSVGLSGPFVITAWSVLQASSSPAESLVVFASAITMFVYGRSCENRRYVVASVVLLNVGLCSIWTSLSLTDPQLYLVPIGLSIIGLVEFLRNEIPQSAHDPIRYAGALTILVSPCFEILGGGWLHMISLMMLSVVVVLLAIGLRLRALVHAGTAFLIVDLVAMVVRSTIDHPGMLWFMGLLVGASVLVLAAVCENNRERLLSRIRILSTELATWN